jgi:hypothetical protein
MLDFIAPLFNFVSDVFNNFSDLVLLILGA